MMIQRMKLTDLASASYNARQELPPEDERYKGLVMSIDTFEPTATLIDGQFAGVRPGSTNGRLDALGWLTQH